MKRTLWICALASLAFSLMGCASMGGMQHATRCAKAELVLAEARNYAVIVEELCNLDESGKCKQAVEAAKMSLEMAEALRVEACK